MTDKVHGAIIEWVDEPPPESTQRWGGATSWVTLAAGTLMTRPGQWALVCKIMRGPGASLQSFKKLGCEAVSRTFDDGVGIYARYVGVSRDPA